MRSSSELAFGVFENNSIAGRVRAIRREVARHSKNLMYVPDVHLALVSVDLFHTKHIDPQSSEGLTICEEGEVFGCETILVQGLLSPLLF